MLQLAVTAHVEVANEVVLADSSLLHGLIRLHSVPASLRRIAGYRFREGQSAGAPAVVQPPSWLHCTSQVCNGSGPDIPRLLSNVRFTPRSGQSPDILACPLGAISCHWGKVIPSSHRRLTASSSGAVRASERPPAASLAASQCVDVLHALRKRRFKPAFAAVLSAEHLAIARRDVDLLGLAVMQTDRHQRAVRRHLVETLPSLANVLAAIERAVFR